MPWCPQCRVEYVAGTTSCVDCEVDLVEVLPQEDHTPEEMVMVYDAPDQESAAIVCATLQAAGIEAILQHQNVGPASGLMPYLGLAWGRGVAVPASQVEAAQALLQSQEPTEAELIAEEEADPLTLEEAEARVKAL